MLLFYFVFHYSSQGVFIILLFIPSMLLLLLSSWSLSYGVFYPFVCYFMVFVSSCCAPHWGGVLTFSGVQPTQCMPLSICMCRYIGGFFGTPIFSFLYTLLDTVPPPIYTRLPSILASLPHFSTMCKLMYFISVADIACMNSYLVCESFAAHVLDFYCWHYMHELPSSKWAMCSSYAWFPLHKLSSREWVMSASVLDFCCWHYLHELPSRQWDMCSSCAQFTLLTLHTWTPIQKVSHVQVVCFVSIADIASMNFYPESEL